MTAISSSRINVPAMPSIPEAAPAPSDAKLSHGWNSRKVNTTDMQKFSVRLSIKGLLFCNYGIRRKLKLSEPPMSQTW